MSIDYTTSNSGDITWEGKTIHLTSEAEAYNEINSDSGIGYKASGVDDNGAKYDIYWSTTPEWDEKIAEGYEPWGDYEDACDWGNPVEVREVD